MRVDAFEDAGALWDIPFEEICHSQFTRGSRRADTAGVATFRMAIDPFDRRLEIACGPGERVATESRLRDEQREADRWLDSNSSFFASGGLLPDPSKRVGDHRLYGDLTGYMDHHGVGVVEAIFARQFVSNPHAGEVVKGHRIVLAEMGLTRAIRGNGWCVIPTTFDYPLDR